MGSSSESILTYEESVFLRGYMDEKPNGGPYHDEVDRHGGDHLAIIQFFSAACFRGMFRGMSAEDLPAEPQTWPWKDLADMKLRHHAIAKARPGSIDGDRLSRPR